MYQSPVRPAPAAAPPAGASRAELLRWAAQRLGAVLPADEASRDATLLLAEAAQCPRASLTAVVWAMRQPPNGEVASLYYFHQIVKTIGGSGS